MEINGKKFNSSNVTVGNYHLVQTVDMYIHEPTAYTSNSEQFTNLRDYGAQDPGNQFFLSLTDYGPVFSIQKKGLFVLIVENNRRQYWQQLEWQPESEEAIKKAAHRFALMIENEHSELEAALGLGQFDVK